MTDKRMTEVSRKWSSSGVNLDAAESEARRLEKKGTFAATMDEEAGTVTLSKDDFKSVMGKLGTHKRTAKTAKKNVLLLAFGYLAVTIGFIAVIVGLVNWRLEATKESHVTDSQLVGRDGTIVETGDVVSYTQLFDLPYFDIATISKVKDVVISLHDGRQFALAITRASKSKGSTRLQLEDANGNGLDIDSCSLIALAKIDGTLYPLKGMTQQTRKLAGSSSPALYSARDFGALRTEQRQLGIGSADIGTIALAIRHTEAVLDANEGYHAPRDWEAAYMETEAIIIQGDVPVVTTQTKVFAERMDGDTNYILGASNGVWLMYVDTANNQIRHYRYHDGHAICLPADETLNQEITNDKTLLTPEVRDCNEDGFVTRDVNEIAITISRTKNVEYGGMATRKIIDIPVVQPIYCAVNLFQRLGHEINVYNQTHQYLDEEPETHTECDMDTYENGEECEDPIGFTEAQEAGRNLAEDIAAFDEATLASQEEKRQLWLGNDEIRRSGNKHSSRKRRYRAPPPRIDKSGPPGDSGEIRPGDTSQGVGKRYQEEPVQRFEEHLRCGGYGSGEAYRIRRNQRGGGRNLIVTRIGGSGSTSYNQREWYCNLLDEYNGDFRELSIAQDYAQVYNHHREYTYLWQEALAGSRNRQFMDHNKFTHEQEVWLGHAAYCAHGVNTGYNCGRINIGEWRVGANIVGLDGGPMWNMWVTCQGWGSRCSILYAYPVIVVSWSGAGWTPQSSGIECVLHFLWDAFLVVIIGQIPLPYRGVPESGGLKFHTGGTVLYCMFVEGCVLHHLSKIYSQWGNISYNLGMSLGGAATAIWTQYRKAKFGTLSWGGYPTCFSNGAAARFVESDEPIIVRGREENNGTDGMSSGAGADLDGFTTQGARPNGLGELLMSFLKSQLNLGIVTKFLYKCGDVKGDRYAGAFDSITGGGEISIHVFKIFEHDMRRAFRVPMNCKYHPNGHYVGNCFAAWGVGAIIYGIFGNIAIIVWNELALPAVNAVCDAIAGWWGDSCSFPSVPLINPVDWCKPSLGIAPNNYKGGGLFDNVRWIILQATGRSAAEGYYQEGISNVSNFNYVLDAIRWFLDIGQALIGLGWFVRIAGREFYFTVLDVACDGLGFWYFHPQKWIQLGLHDYYDHTEDETFWYD